MGHTTILMLVHPDFYLNIKTSQFHPQFAFFNNYIQSSQEKGEEHVNKNSQLTLRCY